MLKARLGQSQRRDSHNLCNSIHKKQWLQICISSDKNLIVSDLGMKKRTKTRLGILSSPIPVFPLMLNVCGNTRMGEDNNYFQSCFCPLFITMSAIILLCY